MTDRDPTHKITQELVVTLNNLLEKNGINTESFELRQLYLILASFTAITLYRAFDSIPQVETTHKHEAIDQYCDVLKECLRVHIE